MKNVLSWLEDKLRITIDVTYNDPTSTPDLNITPDTDLKSEGQKNATYITTKKWGRDVRKALAQWVLLCANLLQKMVDSLKGFETELTQYERKLTDRQEAVEERQSNTESTVTKTLAAMTNAGTDAAAAEVIAARDSPKYGTNATLGARLDYLESIVAGTVPAGVIYTIAHGLNRNPPIAVFYYEYALGTEPDGLGTGPYGFGGSTPVAVNSKVAYIDADTARITLPADYDLEGTPSLAPDGKWYVIDGYKTLCFVIGDGEGTATDGGDDPDNSGSPSDGGNVTPSTPTDLTFTQLTKTSGQLDWKDGA